MKAISAAIPGRIEAAPSGGGTPTQGLTHTVRLHRTEGSMKPTANETPTESRPEPHALYRFFDGDGSLLYVGVTVDPGKRFKQHSAHQPWWADVSVVTIEHFAGRDEVLAAERSAIENEGPVHNAAMGGRKYVRRSREQLFTGLEDRYSGGLLDLLSDDERETA